MKLHASIESIFGLVLFGAVVVGVLSFGMPHISKLANWQGEIQVAAARQQAEIEKEQANAKAAQDKLDLERKRAEQALLLESEAARNKNTIALQESTAAITNQAARTNNEFELARLLIAVFAGIIGVGCFVYSGILVLRYRKDSKQTEQAHSLAVREADMALERIKAQAAVDNGKLRVMERALELLSQHGGEYQDPHGWRATFAPIALPKGEIRHAEIKPLLANNVRDAEDTGGALSDRDAGRINASGA